nr:hypothetical protein [Tanacetum cinerariifolium]
YKEYYACATGEAAPKLKASARKKTSGSASSTTPPTPISTLTPTTTVVAAPRLSATAKGKQHARATTPTEPTDVERTEAEQLKITRGSGCTSDDSEEEISWDSSDDEDVDEQTKGREESEGDKTEESDDDADDQDEADKVINDDDDEKETTKIGEQKVTESDEGDSKATESDKASKDEETREQEEESFDLIPRTPEDDEDDDNNKKDQGVRIGEEERMQEEEDAEELYRDVDINQGWGLQVSQETEDTHVILTPTQSDAQQESSVKSLEDNFSNISGIVNQYIHQQMSEVVREAMQTHTNQLQDSIQRENDEFLKTINENMKKIIKEQVKSQVKAQVTRILPRIEEAVNAQLEAEKILIEKMEGNKSIQRSDEHRNLYKVLVKAYDADKIILDTYGESTILKRRREDDDQEGPSAGSDRGHLSASESAFAEEPMQPTCQMEEPSHPPSKPPTSNRDWNKSVPAAQGEAQSWISALAKQTDARSSFNELLDTPIDFSNFIMNRLGVDTLTPELLADQLDWVNPKGQQYPYNLLQPLPLIPDNQGRSVIPFDHFINNDLEYLRGGASSRKYTTSEPISYDKHALWGVSHWGQKRQQFYGFTVNRESALDVYSKRRIVAVTELKIMEWHNYKHLDWVLVRRDDDKIYKFKQGNFKWLHLQDIEDMLLLLEHCHPEASERSSTGS